ncbi:MAG: galactose-1-phosphate uridylyltransferase [Proteobacteria bacterium]|nr:galactose-1-phosphate uridylyltransferase [Pseudomonadota bacterium]MBU1139360.1 galactose-1-phosphate uridylyltransferase [Pseudomonadota bacterium]MBU1231812.1 galactose-1-phosphate uridylyltransferase [Pseudomonadota bacterium]MBU1419993.1 galactose-1-phosphate uridylyltransferase [Pseudomonadota bacterium]MBU1454776.1 galactose-1-phosphate uridylyltransferase [Pseudomonadota bacterium]
MPELRKDPVLGRWIIIARERGKRPTDFVIAETPTTGGFCPLCPGNENTTPHEVLSYGREHGFPNSPGWKVRVVPNKYPALVIEGDLNREGEGLYDKMNGIGAHEVIIESPRHDDTFADLPPEHLVLVLKAFQHRICDLEHDDRFRYVLIFKNFGKAAGASLEHSHSQLVALPVLPRKIYSELAGASTYFNYKERCVYCDIIHQELKQDVRVVCKNNHFITITPFAPRTPFEMWILPIKHSSAYHQQSDEQLAALAEIFSESLCRLDACIPNVPYNFVLHTQPLRSESMEHFHWHFEIVPKLTSIAGFEWGSGFYINPMPPEEAATYLRESLERIS